MKKYEREFEFICNAILLYICWQGAVEKVEWCENMILFWLGMDFLATILVFITIGIKNSKILKKYKNRKLLPLWIEQCFYFGLIFIAASQAWFVVAFIWFVTMVVNAMIREEIKIYLNKIKDEK